MAFTAFIPLLLGELGISISAGAVGSAVLGSVGVTVAAETVVASAVGGAIIGAGTSALAAAATGTNIMKAAEIGALTGGIGSALTPVLTGALGSGLSNIPGGAALSKGLGTAISGEVAGTAGGLAAGQDFTKAARGALPGALASGLSTGLMAGISDLSGRDLGSAGKFAGTALQQALTPALSKGLGVNKAPSYSVSNQPTQMTQTAQNMPSSALGGALASSPGFAYAPGSTIFGSSDKDQKPASDVWGSSSLRGVSETVT